MSWQMRRRDNTSVSGIEIASFPEKPTVKEMTEVIAQYEDPHIAEASAGVLVNYPEIQMRDSVNTVYEVVNLGER